MLTRQECYLILGLETSAGPNAIKQSYRKLAFELHPDLHPDIPDAAKRFQRLNEAYVLLMREYANTSHGARPQGDGAAGTSETPPGEDKKSRDEAHKAYQRARHDFEDQGAAQTNARQEGGHTGPDGTGARRNKREEILRDLLNDPFARHVFEDIYSHVRHNEGKNAAPPKPAERPKKQRKKIEVKPLERPWAFSVGGKMLGLAGGIKNWLRRQIDDEQVMFLHGEALYPGARLRLQVWRGLSNKSQVVEVTLPPEFKLGAPIRLRGLGKRLGGLRGDLYLRVFEREEKEEE